jgi:hypothetical protein
VIDYRILQDQATGTYIILADRLSTLAYTATTLQMGLTYKFKVQSRNAFGFSLDSNEVSILQAEKPLVPIAPTTIVVTDTYVIIQWVAPSNQGSSITAYTISILTNDGVTFATDTINCNGSNQ